MSFFAPPKRVETIVWSRLPDRFRKMVPTAWGEWNRGGKPVDCFLEGPAFDAEGNLLVTDIPFGRIFRISPAGEWELLLQYDGWPNGMKRAADGRFVITDYKHGLLNFDAESRTITPLLEMVRSEGFKGVNDLCFGADGSIFFTDQGQTGLHDATGRVYRLRPDGRLDTLIDTIPSPNGIVVAPDLSFVLVAVTRANQIWRLPLHRDGSVTKASIFAHLHGGTSGPDGLALDEAGNLLVAHAGFGTVWQLSPRAEPLLRIASAAGWTTTNMALQGRSLFITESETGVIAHQGGNEGLRSGSGHESRYG